jgi:hypothetical protein
MLKNAGESIVIATGEGKRDAFEKIGEGEMLPVVLIEPDVWFVGEDAVGIWSMQKIMIVKGGLQSVFFIS